jgi:hypothetical protein
MKEQLVGQLKTQITDLERFIQFLQGISLLAFIYYFLVISQSENGCRILTNNKFI